MIIQIKSDLGSFTRKHKIEKNENFALTNIQIKGNRENIKIIMTFIFFPIYFYPSRLALYGEYKYVNIKSGYN